MPSHHAVLPDFFTDEAVRCLDWRSKIAISSIWNFRMKNSQFFSEKALPSKVIEELKTTVWPDCHDLIRSIPVEDDFKSELEALSNRLFSQL